MFGLIPRVVWSRAVPCDDKNRIEVAHNALLLESVGGGPKRRVVIEVGTGDKLDAKMSGIFGLDGRTIEHALADAGTSCEDIDAVVVTHLHFDHAGALTRRVRPGEEPDWTCGSGEASGDSPNVKFTFPRAEVICQAREWRDALANNSVMTRTYYKDHLLPLQKPLPDGRPRLRLVDSPPPFAPGAHPGRDDLPASPVELRETEVIPGIFVFLTPGHTWGQQAIRFVDDQDRSVVFTPDVMPTAHHAGAAYSLGYDVEPYVSMISRHWLLDEAVRGDWLLVLDHEPGQPLRRVRRAGSWFELVTP